MASSSGSRRPAWRPNVRAVGRVMSCDEALRCVGMSPGARWWIVPGAAPLQMASITIARS